jgi:hypothetical protein
LILTGQYSPPQILALANTEWHFRTRQTRKQGGKPLARSAIYRLFTDPFYYSSFTKSVAKTARVLRCWVGV